MKYKWNTFYREHDSGTKDKCNDRYCNNTLCHPEPVEDLLNRVEQQEWEIYKILFRPEQRYATMEYDTYSRSSTGLKSRIQYTPSAIGVIARKKLTLKEKINEKIFRRSQ
jgi:hypothetical protein